MSTYKKILVTVDLTDDSQRVCRRALAIAGDTPCSIYLLHVVEYVYQVSVAYDPMFYPAFEDLSVSEEELLKQAGKRMEKLTAELDIPANIHFKSDVISGIPKSEIIRLAEEQASDLIVCGSHGRNGFELLLGSTANAILHHAPCDVLAVRTRKEKDK